MFIVAVFYWCCYRNLHWYWLRTFLTASSKVSSSSLSLVRINYSPPFLATPTNSSVCKAMSKCFNSSICYGLQLNTLFLGVSFFKWGFMNKIWGARHWKSFTFQPKNLCPSSFLLIRNNDSPLLVCVTDPVTIVIPFLLNLEFGSTNYYVVFEKHAKQGPWLQQECHLQITWDALHSFVCLPASNVLTGWQPLVYLYLPHGRMKVLRFCDPSLKMAWW